MHSHAAAHGRLQTKIQILLVVGGATDQVCATGQRDQLTVARRLTVGENWRSVEDWTEWRYGLSLQALEMKTPMRRSVGWWLVKAPGDWWEDVGGSRHGQRE